MKQIFLSIPFLFISGILTIAQVGKVSNNSFYSKARVYISIDQPVRGQAKEDKKIFIDPNKGSFAYVIIDNYPDKFLSKKIRLVSYKKNNGQYDKINSTDYDIDGSFTYTFIKYSFNSTGDYAFDAYDGNGTFIKSGFVLVDSDANNSPSNTGTKGSNYSGARAFISVEVPVSGVATESKIINIDRSDGGYAYIVLDNYPNKMNTNQIRLKSYRKINGSYEKLNEQAYDIDAEIFFTYIKYSFYTSGDYAFDIYDKSGGFIKTANVTVQYK
jgi:hypothetical protein